MSITSHLQLKADERRARVAMKTSRHDSQQLAKFVEDYGTPEEKKNEAAKPQDRASRGQLESHGKLREPDAAVREREGRLNARRVRRSK